MTCWICRPDGRLGEDNTAFCAGAAAEELFRVVSHDYPSLAFRLATLVRDGGSPFFEGRETLHQYLFQDGRYSEAKAQIEKTHFLKYGKKWGFTMTFLSAVKLYAGMACS